MNATDVARLDYTQPPPGYVVRYEPCSMENGEGPPCWWWGTPEYAASAAEKDDVLAAAWAHWKERHDPPGIQVAILAGVPNCELGNPAFEAGRTRFKFWLSNGSASNPYWYTQEEARAAAWAWYERRLALPNRIADDPRHRIDFCGSCGEENEPQDDDECPACGATSCLISTWGEGQAERYRTGERYTTPEGQSDVDGANPLWPRILTWSDDQVAAVERWLIDSTAELPEVLRG